MTDDFNPLNNLYKMLQEVRRLGSNLGSVDLSRIEMLESRLRPLLDGPATVTPEIQLILKEIREEIDAQIQVLSAESEKAKNTLQKVSAQKRASKSYNEGAES